jgi:tRNA 2-thiouridine synthesizing protein A
MEEVDVTGEICPRPALIVRRVLSELEPGDEVLVKGDYPPAERNLRRTCYKHGFQVAAGPGDSDDSDDFELQIRVTEEANIPEA